jgi:hypothetical protein
MLHVKLLP